MNTKRGLLLPAVRLVGMVIATGLLVLLASQVVQAGTAGKIAGVIKDTESGIPLPGASVIIKGTSIGTSTDEDGEYFKAITIPRDDIIHISSDYHP